MRVLVTGHNGYIGSVLTPLLARAGHDVVGLDADLFADRIHGPRPEPVPAWRVDLRDVEPEHVVGLDAVIHLAALSNDPLGDLEPEHTYAINLDASVRLAELARAAGATRFLYSSSCSVYGASDTGQLLDESAPMAPVTPYARSKVAVEEELRGLAGERFAPVYFRNATAYGWSPRLRLDVVVNDLTARAVLDGEVRVLSDGTPWRPVVHVEDISRAFLAALEAPVDAVHDEAFNVVPDGGNHTIGELAEIVAEVVADAEVVIAGVDGSDPRTYRVDGSKLRDRLPSFQPRWDVDAGVRQLEAAFREHGLTRAEHERDFVRLAWLSELRRRGDVDGGLRHRATDRATSRP